MVFSFSLGQPLTIPVMLLLFVVHHKVLSLNHRKMRDIISYAVSYIRSSFSKTSRIEICDIDLPLQYKQSESMNEKLTSTKNQGLNALRETGQGKQCSLWRLHGVKASFITFSVPKI